MRTPRPRPSPWIVAATTACLAAGAAYADSAPRLLEAPEVSLPPEGDFPPDASVRLEITIDATGAVTEARVIESLRTDIDNQVLDAARRMRFQPAERGGLAVPARMRFRFRLRPAAPRTPAATSVIPANPYDPAAPPWTGPPPASPSRPPAPSRP